METGCIGRALPAADFDFLIPRKNPTALHKQSVKYAMLAIVPIAAITSIAWRA